MKPKLRTLKRVFAAQAALLKRSAIEINDAIQWWRLKTVAKFCQFFRKHQVGVLIINASITLIGKLALDYGVIGGKQIVNSLLYFLNNLP